MSCGGRKSSAKLFFFASSSEPGILRDEPAENYKYTCGQQYIIVLMMGGGGRVECLWDIPLLRIYDANIQ